MSSYDLLGLLIVLAIPIAGIALVAGTVVWARDAIRRSPRTGSLGVGLTAMAGANLLVARACGSGVNRPIIDFAVGHDDCLRAGLLSVELVLLLAVTTSVVVRLGDVRR